MPLAPTRASSPAASGTAAGALPAVVLGGHVTALGVVRSLAPLGIPTYLVSARGDYAAASRWAKRLDGSPPESLDPEPLATFLESLPFERALLLPCSDDWARAVAALPGDVRERYPAPVAPLDVLELFLDKERFAELVVRLDVPHPLTHVLQPGDTATVDDLRFGTGGSRFFLKPSDSQEFVRHFGVKAFAVESQAEARARLEEVWGAGVQRMLLQEYVPGPASSHYFVDGFVTVAGQTAARLARRRLRMYPPDFGNSTYHVTVPLDEVADAAAQLERLLDGVGFHGIFSAEFKRDERDSELKILEVNVRPWWYVHFATSCGVNVCELAHREASGLPVEPREGYEVGARCALRGADLRAYRQQRGPEGVGLWSWLRSWLGARRVVFDTRDPVPGLLHLKEVALRSLRHRRPARLGGSETP